MTTEEVRKYCVQVKVNRRRALPFSILRLLLLAMLWLHVK